jgi:23S rRNA (uracil1939-C5)-methyltransferase
MAAGGRAVARHEGRVIFVEGAAPQERVRVQITQDKGRFLEGRVTSIVSPSADRVEPRCQHFGTCGGCSWQYLSRPAQLRAKVQLLEDAMGRLGKLPSWPTVEVVAGPDWHSRNRVQFQPPGRVGAPWGFFAAGSRHTVGLQECPVLAPELQGAWNALADREADPLARRRERAAFAWGAQGQAWIQAPQDPEQIAEVQIRGRRFQFLVDGFFQSNFGLLESFVDLVTDGLQGQRAWDLYAGVGLFAAFLEPHFAQIDAVECDPRARRFGPRNLQKAQYHDAPVEDWLEQQLASGKPQVDAVVVDPPREGLSDRAREALLAIRPPVLRYASCGHDTLGRDLGQLVRGGFQLERVVVLDLYPHTPHLEVVCHLRYPQA